MIKNIFFTLLLLPFLFSCQSLETKQNMQTKSSEKSSEQLLKEWPEKNSERKRAWKEANQTPVMNRPPKPDSGFVSNVAIKQVEARELTDSVDENEPTYPVEFSFKQTSLLNIIETFLGDFLGLPYTVLDDFKDKKVNFVFKAKELTRSKVLALFESFLTYQGVSLKYSNGIYAITQSSSKLHSQPDSSPLSSSYAIFKLRYIEASELNNIIREFISDKTGIKILSKINTLSVIAPDPQIKSIEKLVSELDVPLLQGKYLLVYAPRYLQLSSLKTLVSQYLKSFSPKTSAQKSLADVEEVKELNRLVIIAYDQVTRDKLIEYINRIDTQSSDERQLFQYSVIGKKAEEIVKPIQTLTDSLFNTREKLSIVAEKTSNSIFVIATPAEYAEILNFIQRIDKPIPSLHILVTIAKVRLTDEFKYGVEWFLNFKTSDLLGGGITNLPAPNLDPNQARTNKGTFFSITDRNSNKFIAIQALQSNANFHVLSNPNILVKDGYNAKIVVGEDRAIPKQTFTSVSDAANTPNPGQQTEFERKPIGITLEVKPTIAVDGTVALAIKLKDERFDGNDNNGQPLFSTSELDTELQVADNDTIILGGIIQENNTTANDKVPVLGDIPMLKYAFNNETTEQVRNELIMLVTTRIIDRQSTSQLITNAVRASMPSIDKKWKRSETNKNMN